MIHMKKMAVAVAIAAASVGGAQATTLGAGDLSFVGLNEQAKSFQLLSFTDIAAGDSIWISDNNWNGTSWSATAESSYQYTFAAAATAGSIITITTGASISALTSTADNLYISSANGSGFITSLSYIDPTSTSNTPTTGTGLSASQVVSVYNSGSPSLSTNVATSKNMNGLVDPLSTSSGTWSGNTATAGMWCDGGSASSNTCANNGLGTTKFAEYVGIQTGTREDLQAAISNTNNWVVSARGSTSTAFKTDYAFSVTAVPEASTYAMLLAGLGMIGVMARRRTNA